MQFILKLTGSQINYKTHLFIVGTTIEAIQAQCAQEVQAAVPANSDCSIAINDAVMTKLEKSTAFKALQGLGIFRRNFTTAPNKKETFRV